MGPVSRIAWLGKCARRLFVVCPTAVGVAVVALTFVQLNTLTPTEARNQLAVSGSWHARIDIGPTTQVSADDPLRREVEVMVGADPADANRLLACSTVEPHHPSPKKWSTVEYESTDGGRTWRAAFDLEGNTPSGDPACGYTTKGAAVFLAIDYFPSLIPYTAEAVTVWVRTSSGGWRSTHIAHGDREFLITNNDPQSRNRDIYVVDHLAQLGRVLAPQGRMDGMAVYRSGDGGKTFWTMSEYVETPTLSIFGQGGMFSDGGSVIAPVLSFNNDQTMMRKPKLRVPPKVNGLVEVALPKEPFQYIPEPYVMVNRSYGCDYQGANWYVPTLAVDSSHSRFRDSAYLAWLDYRSGRCALLIAHSRDKGRTWSKPVAADDDRGIRPHLMGPDVANVAIAVNRDGVVGVMFYDRQNLPDNLDWQPRFTASLDGGQTFGPSVPLTNAINDYNEPSQHFMAETLTQSTKSGRTEFSVALGTTPKAAGGETAGLAAGPDGVFHPVWVDNHTGIDQVWSARVRVSNGSGSRSLDRDTASNASVSGRYNPQARSGKTRQCATRVNRSWDQKRLGSTTLDFSDVWLDRNAETLSGDAYVINTSSKPLALPLTFRVTSLTSWWGRPSALNVNGQTVAAPCWQFRSTHGALSLMPGEGSAPFHFVIKYAGLRRAVYPYTNPLGEYVDLKGTLLPGSL